MRDLNRAELIGNLTRDPELRTTPSGQSVVSFTIATNRSWVNPTGEKQDAVEYTDVVAWGKLAELISQYLVKGRRVWLEGRLQTRSWEGPDGSKRYKTEVIASNIIFLDRSPGGEKAPIEPTTSASPTEMPPAESGEEMINLDDIPF